MESFNDSRMFRLFLTCDITKTPAEAFKALCQLIDQEGNNSQVLSRRPLQAVLIPVGHNRDEMVYSIMNRSSPDGSIFYIKDKSGYLFFGRKHRGELNF